MTPVEFCQSAKIIVAEGVTLPLAFQGLILGDRCPKGTRDATLVPALRAVCVYVEPFEEFPAETDEEQDRLMKTFLSFCSTLLKDRSAQIDALDFAITFLGGKPDEAS